MTATLRIGAAGTLLLALAACGSPQNTYYMLSPSPGAAMPSASGRTLALDDVSVPASLDKPQVVVGLDDNRVDVREYDRWASPFEGMVHQTLAEDLRARLGDQLLDRPGKNTLLLSVSLDAFGRQGDQVVLRGRWTLKDPGKDNVTPTPHPFDQSTPIDPKADLQTSVAAMSRLLGAAADDIARSVGR